MTDIWKEMDSAPGGCIILGLGFDSEKSRDLGHDNGFPPYITEMKMWKIGKAHGWSRRNNGGSRSCGFFPIAWSIIPLIPNCILDKIKCTKEHLEHGLGV